jgi:PAS domain S-box-containing protein
LQGLAVASFRPFAKVYGMSLPSTIAPQQENVTRRLDPGLGDLRALTQVIIEISRSLDLENVLQASLDGIQAVVNGDSGCFLLVQSGAPTLQLANADSLPSPLREYLQSFALAPDILSDPSSVTNGIRIISTIGQRVGEILKAQSMDSYLLLPLTAQGRAIGVLLVVTSAGKVLEPRSVDLLMSIGEQVGMAIENARLHASVREAGEWHRAFMENSLDAFWEVDLNGRIRYVNDSTCRLLGYDRATLLQMRSSDFALDTPGSRQASSRELREKGVLTNRDAQIRICSGEIRTVNYSTRVVRDSQGNIVRFQSISRDVTERRSLTETLHHRNEELAALNAIANILSHPLDIAHSLDLVCEQITSITGMEGVALYLIDESQSFLSLLASRGLSENLTNLGRRLGLDDPLTRRVAIDGENFAVDDMILYTEPSLAGPRQEGYHAGIAVPILKQGTPIGAIFVGTRNKCEYEKSDIDLLLNVGKQIGQAVENANLYAQMQRRVSELDGLAQLSAACAASLDPLTISTLAMEWTRKLLDVDVADLRLLHDQDLYPVAAKALRPEFAYPESIPLGELFNPLVEMRSPLVIDELEKEPQTSLEASLGLQQRGLAALLVVPLSSREQVIGTLAAAHSHPHLWTQSEVDLLQTIANQVANTVDNAQLFQNVLSEQRKIQAIFESGLSGLYATDARGRIVMFNHAAEYSTGWTLREVQGRLWQDVFGDSKPLIATAFERKESAYDPEGRELKVRDGRMIPVAEAVAPLFDEKGEVNGAVGAFWDLTKEKQAEWSREHFLTMVAHQLRSPLSAVLSALQLLERQGLSAARRAELWAVVKSDGVRLKKFADEFLNLESAVQLPQPLQLEPVSMVALARSLIRRIRGDRCRHYFRVKSSKPEPLVLADAGRVENVLRNLLDNAANYSPAKSLITISVQARQDMVDISVRDQGQGIPAEDCERIFEPFYRSTQLAGQPSEWHGLGLFIARNMVKEMKGEVWLDPAQGRGTTFHFTLRMYK